MPLGKSTAAAGGPAKATKASEPAANGRAAGSVSLIDPELREAALKYFTAATQYFAAGNTLVSRLEKLEKRLGDGGTVSRPPQSSPGPQPTVSAAPATTAPSSATGATSVASPAASAEATPGASGGDLETMTRKELVVIARGLGVETTGKKAEDLRVLIKQAGGNSVAGPVAPAPAAGAAAQEKKARILMQLIEDNYETFESSVDPESTEEGALRCGGDCIRCPNPEGYPSSAGQVDACFISIHEVLGLAVPAV